MNQPAEERFKRLEEEQKNLREEFRKLKEQITEPIKVTRLEIDSGSMHELLVQANNRLEQIIQTQTDRSERFDTLERGQQELKQDLHTLSDNWLDSLQENVDELKQDIAGVSADTLKIRESQGDFRDTLLEVKETMATKEDIKNMATKEDLAVMATKDDITRLEGLMLQLLQQKPPES
jgi:hypothetical protein